MGAFNEIDSLVKEASKDAPALVDTESIRGIPHLTRDRDGMMQIVGDRPPKLKNAILLSEQEAIGLYLDIMRMLRRTKNDSFRSDFSKSASSVILDEIKLILDGIGKNRLTGSEAARSAAIGAISSAIAGAGIGALSGKRGKRIKKALKGAVLGAIAGSIGGPAYSQLRKYLDGIPFDNSSFYSSNHKKGDKVYLGVAGSSNGEGESWFADEMRKRFPGNVVMQRHVDDIGKKYKELKDKGYDVTLVGHSSGGATVGKFLRNNPTAKGYLIDPVSWTGRGVPDNAVVFTSDKSTRHGGPAENTIADFGGRWNYEGKNSVLFKGSHSNRMGHIIRDFVQPGIRPGDKIENKPNYVTSIFGKTASWMDFAGISKKADMNDPPTMLVKDKRRAVPSAYYDGRQEGPLARRTYGSSRLKPDDGKFLGFDTFTLEDEARQYKDEDLKSSGLYQDSDPYYHNILVGGANAAGRGFTALSALPFGILAKGRNRELFRNGQVKEVESAIENALSQGRHPRVAAHSWGASSVFHLALKYPEVPFILADPVSWMGVPKSIPKNVTILRPDNSNSEGSSIKRNGLINTGRLAQIFGHQWPRIEKGEGKTVTYKGDHTVGVGPAITALVEKERRERVKDFLNGKMKDMAESFPGFKAY